MDKVVDELDSHSAFLYTIILDDRLELILKLSSENDLIHSRNQISRKVLIDRVDQFKVIIQKQSQVERAKIQEEAEQLYDWLLKPVDQRLRSINTLVFVLDSELSSLPMQALRKNEKYLIEDYAVAVTPSLQLLGPKPPNIEPLKPLIAGVYEAPPGSSERDLPSVRKEIEIIQSLALESKALKNEEFTLENLRKELVNQPFPVVHLASHGEFSSQPETTYILAGDGLRINAKKLGDAIKGRARARSEAIKLVFFSACRTAEGDRRAALGIAGVTVKAGARSTIAALWYAEDRQSAQLATSFYRYWYDGTAGNKAQALQKAQLDMIQENSMPVYWAHYTLIGDWL
ncbi:MAG: CHAT domain-containing protein [Leptolyngbya sp. SIO4C5]|nr:CHAT domain-containing protein [Leptolyngbya sp. SIO4C5]